MNKQRFSHGFSLVESTLVVVVTGIVACMVIPGLLRYIRYCRLDGAAQVIRSPQIGRGRERRCREQRQHRPLGHPWGTAPA